jgi:hypothetical protein
MKKIIGMGMLAIALIAASPAFADGKGEKTKKAKCVKAKTCTKKSCERTCDPSSCMDTCPFCHKH